MASKPKICLTTYFNPSYNRTGQLCFRSLKKYGEIFGYPIILHNNVTSDRRTPWNKVLVIKKLLAEGHQFIFHIDADAIITRFDKDIADEIEADKEWYMTRQEKEFTDGRMPNCGVLLIKNTPHTRYVIDELWNATYYLNHPWCEQAAFIEMTGLRSELPLRFRADIKEGDDINNNLLRTIKWLDEEWNEHINFVTIKSKIIHIRGGRRCHKLWYLNRYAYQCGLLNTDEFIKNAVIALTWRAFNK